MAVLPNMREYVRRPGSLTPSYGLFKVVTAMGAMVEGGVMPAHAGQGGVLYETHVCGLPYCFETNCIDTLGTKTIDDEFTVVTGDLFVIVTDLTCGMVGLTEERTRNFLREKAVAGEQAAVELAFSNGDCGLNPSLANSTPWPRPWLPVPTRWLPSPCWKRSVLDIWPGRRPSRPVLRGSVAWRPTT